MLLDLHNVDLFQDRSHEVGVWGDGEVPTLLRCPDNTRVQSHASTSVRTLTIPNTGSRTIAGHTKILHTLTEMGSAALAAAVSYPGKATRISRKGQGRVLFLFVFFKISVSFS